MGLYTHEGVEGDLTVLREIGTGVVCRAAVPSGTSARKGSCGTSGYFTSAAGGSEHVAFTTPYVVLRPGLTEWLAYFGRTFPGNGRLVSTSGT